MGILLDKLLNYRVIDPTSVITWIFEADQLKFAGRSFIWEILKNTLSKVNSRVVQVKAKLDNFKLLHKANTAKRAESEMSESKFLCPYPKNSFINLCILLVAEAEAQQELDSMRIVENSLASVTREQKEVFMIVYQKFAGVLRDLINSNPDVESSYVYKWVFGWYREILRVVTIFFFFLISVLCMVANLLRL